MKHHFQVSLRDRAALLSLLAETDFAKLIEDIYVDVSTSVLDGGQILFAGNGGSAADAQHLAAEYVGIGLAGVSLAADSSVLTALGNDDGFDMVFENALRAVGRAHDVLVVHSTSGTSQNVVRAVRAAQEVGIVSVALTGRGGGDLKGLADHCLAVPSDDTQVVQEVHLAVGHLVWDAVREVALIASEEADS